MKALLSKENVAQLISNVANPAILLIAAVMFVIWRYADDVEEFWRFSLVATGLLVLPGFLYVAATIWRKERTIDIDLSNRHDRVVPLMLASLGSLIAGFLIHQEQVNQRLEAMSYILVALLIALTIITLVWKISLHAATLSALVTLVVVLRGDIFVWFYLLLLPISWARLVLKQHTLQQLIAGALVGATITAFLATIFTPDF